MYFKKIDIRAAIIFIAAHFVSVGIYDLLVVNDKFVIAKGGFVLHMLQAAVFLSLPLLKLKFELSVAAAATAICYCLNAINWAFMERGIEVGIQSYCYSNFASIIMTINLIVIYLLGKDGAIHLFNRLLRYPDFRSRVQLFFRGADSNSVRGIDLPISAQDFKDKEGCK